MQLDGVERFHYAAPTTGRIGGRMVACCPIDTQIAAHLGYEPDEHDLADLRALAAKFRLERPLPYAPSQRTDGPNGVP
ncbi:MAG: nucleotidyltransferase domain-containing protein [Acidimicrobiales bacterium]